MDSRTEASMISFKLTEKIQDAGTSYFRSGFVLYANYSHLSETLFVTHECAPALNCLHHALAGQKEKLNKCFCGKFLKHCIYHFKNGKQNLAD